MKMIQGTKVTFYLIKRNIPGNTGVLNLIFLKHRLREDGISYKRYQDNFKRRAWRGIEQERTFHYEGGLKEFVEYLNKGKVPLYDNIIYCEGVKDNVQVEVAFQHNDGYNEVIDSFCK